jgi:hypothetical protein
MQELPTCLLHPRQTKQYLLVQQLTGRAMLLLPVDPKGRQGLPVEGKDAYSRRHSKNRRGVIPVIAV